MQQCYVAHSEKSERRRKTQEIVIWSHRYPSDLSYHRRSHRSSIQAPPVGRIRHYPQGANPFIHSFQTLNNKSFWKVHLVRFEFEVKFRFCLHPMSQFVVLEVGSHSRLKWESVDAVRQLVTCCVALFFIVNLFILLFVLLTRFRVWFGDWKLELALLQAPKMGSHDSNGNYSDLNFLVCVRIPVKCNMNEFSFQFISRVSFTFCLELKVLALMSLVIQS